MKAPFDPSAPRWCQLLFPLTRTVTVEIRRRCMCIPTRDDAKEEERRIRKEYCPAIIGVKISKNGKAPTATYTCAYTLRETRTETLY